MGIKLRVFCRSGGTITRRQVAEWIEEGAVLGARPVFDPEPTAPSAEAPDWDYMEITYNRKRRPIVIERVAEPGEVAESAEETVEWMERYAPDEPPRELVDALRESRQMFVFEVGAELPEKAWELVDIAQSFVARELDGLVAADEGIFDPDLQPLLRYEAE
jgi:hypothetical protein